MKTSLKDRQYAVTLWAINKFKPKEGRLLTTKEIADAFGVSSRTIYYWIRNTNGIDFPSNPRYIDYPETDWCEKPECDNCKYRSLAYCCKLLPHPYC